MSGPHVDLLLKQFQDQLWTGITDGQSLNTQLKLDLQGNQIGAFFGQVGINKIANPFFHDVDEFAREFCLDIDTTGG